MREPLPAAEIEIQDRLQRKREFLRGAGDDYGYASSPGGLIDEWRPCELPGLILPVSDATGRSQKRLGCSDALTVSNDEGHEKEVYLDYAGSALPTLTQLKHVLERNTTILANPHSTGPAASRTTNLTEQAVKCVLDHFHAHSGRFMGMLCDENISNEADHHPGYEIVFTSGATEALKIVAERFPWMSCRFCNSKSLLVYPHNAHTSVVGMRGVALNNGAANFLCKPIDELLDDINNCTEKERLDGKWKSDRRTDCSCRGVRNLLVLPLECNFGGDRPDVPHAFRKLQEFSSSSSSSAESATDCSSANHQRWYTMVDMAKAASTGPVHLCKLNPDFACISFYKMFGEPTGLGCLFVKRTATNVLTMESDTAITAPRFYFGGGSVDAILPFADFAVRRSEPTLLASLQNGTTHFRGITSLISGFNELKRVGGMAMIKRHTESLAVGLVVRLQGLQHSNGHSAIAIYGAWKSYIATTKATTLPGPTVAFNILRADGSFVGYNEVSKLAALNRPSIQLRTGCFCNPGACQLALDLTDDDVINNYKEFGHVCGDQVDVVRGRPTGAIRVSFGKDSMWEDLDALLDFLESMFVSKNDQIGDGVVSVTRWDDRPSQAVVSELYIFPIKSCAAQRVTKWQLDSLSGILRFDREFALVDSSGSAMRLQTHPKMSFLQPEINVNENILAITAPSQPVLILSLDDNSKHTRGSSTIKVCGNRCDGMLWGDFAVSDWFTGFLGVRCWLARYSGRGYEHPELTQPRLLRDRHFSFANEQPLLLISENAVEVLNGVLTSQTQKTVSSRHFRPNIVIRLAGYHATSSISQHVEDGWSCVQFLRQKTMLQVTGPCARCSMVDVDPSSGVRGKTLQALAGYRRYNGQITFGIFLRGTGRRKGSPKTPEWVVIQEGDSLLCE